MKKIFTYCIAGILILAGIFMLMGLTTNWSNKGIENLGEDLLYALILIAFPIGSGIFLIVRQNRLTENMSEFNEEQQLLALANQKNGSLTINDVALHLKIPFKEAEKLLLENYEKGMFHLQLSNKGAKVYQLSSFATDEDKKSAEDII